MKWLAATIIIAATARAAQTNWPSVKAQPGKPVEQTEKAKAVTVEKFKIKADKQKDGKQAAREFPLMFDIAQRVQKVKAEKIKEEKEKKPK